MEWTIAQAGHDYTIDLTLFATAGFFLLVTFGLTIALAVLRRGWERVHLGGGGIVVVILISFILAGFLLAPLGVAFIGAGTSFLEGAMNRNRSVWIPFGQVLWAELALAFLGSLLLTVAFGLTTRKRPQKGRRLGAVLLWLVLLGTWSMTQGAAAHAVLLAGYSRLPQFEDQTFEWVHAGQAVQIESKLRHAKTHHRWSIAANQSIKGGDEQVVSFVERASTNWLIITKRSKLAVKSNRGHPAFPLRVGNQWIYSKVSRSGTRVLLVLGGENKQVAENAWTLEVTDSIVENGVRRYAVESRVSGELDRTRWFVAADGELFQWQEGNLKQLTLPEPGEHEEFQFPLKFGSWRGVSKVSEQTAVPGPCVCSRSRSGVGNAIVAVASLGMIIPSGSDSWRLVKSIRGPESANAPADQSPSEDQPLSQESCPPANIETLQHCLQGRAMHSRERERERFFRKLNKAGLGAVLSGRHVYINGTSEQLSQHLKIDVTHTNEPGLCPGENVCTRQLEHVGRARIWRHGLAGLKLVQDGFCSAR